VSSDLPMRVFVFVGPTIPVLEARRHLDATYLPPVAQGDVYRVACLQPFAIGIIDGYFEAVPSVWHKEILWAMSRGISVYGSASMGALRAAELAAFGMQGVGKVFEAFRDGATEDDDEVAVLHAPAERNYASISVAMINIRATVAVAVAAGVLTASSGLELERIAKELFYPERCYEEILSCGVKRGLRSDEVESFRKWLPRGQVDQKREDAVAMLQAIRSDIDNNKEKEPVLYRFEPTLACTAMMDRERG
jgi:hypothetical protein